MTTRQFAEGKRRGPKKSLVYGVGVNDADYPTCWEQEGARAKVKCPYYERWRKMLERCYSENFHKTRPSYKDCTVTEEWKTFSNFRKWMVQQEWEGMALDKDFKVMGNRVYGPDTCLFIPHTLNNLFNKARSAETLLPIGVYAIKSSKKNPFIARISLDGVLTPLGSYPTPEEAAKVYAEARNNYLREKAYEYPQYASYILERLMEIPMQNKTVYVVEMVGSPDDKVVGVFASDELARRFINAQDGSLGFFVSHHIMVSE